SPLGGDGVGVGSWSRRAIDDARRERAFLVILVPIVLAAHLAMGARCSIGTRGDAANPLDQAEGEHPPAASDHRRPRARGTLPSRGEWLLKGNLGPAVSAGQHLKEFPSLGWRRAQSRLAGSLPGPSPRASFVAESKEGWGFLRAGGANKLLTDRR